MGTPELSELNSLTDGTLVRGTERNSEEGERCGVDWKTGGRKGLSVVGVSTDRLGGQDGSRNRELLTDSWNEGCMENDGNR